MPDVPDVSDLLARLGGIATRDQLIAGGIRGAEISVAVAAGRARRIRRAHYGSPGAPAAGISAVRIGGRLGCVSAAATLGIWTNDDGRVHVSLPANAARLRTNRALVASAEPLSSDRQLLEVELHWVDVPVGARGPGESAWRVPVPRALAQIAACRPRLEVRAAFESAVNARLLSLVDAQRLLDDAAPRRLGPLTLNGLDGSGAETYLADEFRRLGIAFAQQVPFARVGFVDFLVEGCLVVEVDGFGFHSGRAEFRRDRARDRVMLRNGFPTLRIPADEVLADAPGAALEVVALAALRR
ncbi:endonuclease domain-containing protein [Agromyces sp. NPDC057865]|uniref:endonuclease domain-containing protein n=1 Tax=Agromyces sp. NPDC057865 TaxID=3346267 RepID=UPI00366A9092